MTSDLILQTPCQSERLDPKHYGTVEILPELVGGNSQASQPWLFPVNPVRNKQVSETYTTEKNLGAPKTPGLAMLQRRFVCVFWDVFGCVFLFSYLFLLGGHPGVVSLKKMKIPLTALVRSSTCCQDGHVVSLLI